MNNAGFTLIEVVVYLALFGILFTGAIAGAYSILETANKNQVRAMMQEEGEFLIAKINWAVSNASSAAVPSSGVLQATVLSDNLEFTQSGNDLVLEKNSSGIDIKLNNSAVSIGDDGAGNSSLFFVDLSNSGTGQKGINYGFELDAKTANGATLTSSFESTAYLRK